MENSPIKILVVDDNADNIFSLKALIHEAFPEVRILTASSGKEGFSLAVTHDPDVVLLDIIMPDMDGFAVCLALKADKKARDIPVVFVTALREKENRVRALEAGAEGFLNKPIDEIELAAQIRAMVKIKAAHTWEQSEKGRLAQLVAARTSELQKEFEERIHVQETLRTMEARLRQSEKMEAIGQLAGGIAHDFNNILGGIIGYADISLELVEKGSLLETNLLQILKSSNRAKHLVKQILTFSRKGIPQRTVVPLLPVVTEIVELLTASIPSSIVIKTFLDSESKPVLADQTQIHEVILNLATNAVFAMQRKGTLSIQVSPVSLTSEYYCRNGKLSPGDYTLIEVGDTGCGIEKQVLEKMFDPFFTTKPIGEGTGMGLSVVLGIVLAHGGDLQVETELGKGSLFRIFLPACSTPYTPEPDYSSMPIVGGTERVLFVDDEEALVAIATEVLESLGYKVTGMTSSSAALQLFEKQSSDFDILMTDQTMPGITGIELSKAVRALRPDLPIILCSGNAGDIESKRALCAGIDRLVMKPLLKRELAAVVRNVLDRCTNDVLVGA